MITRARHNIKSNPARLFVNNHPFILDNKTLMNLDCHHLYGFVRLEKNKYSWSPWFIFGVSGIKNVTIPSVIKHV